MGHAHYHEHEHEDLKGLNLLITIVLNFIITAVEIVGGFFSGSLSLVSDALHNFSDGISVIISYVAIRLKQRDNSYKHTFGLKRAEILAALINSSVLIAISIYLFIHAVSRFLSPEKIDAKIMVGVAAIGLFANVCGTLLLRSGAKGSMNIRSSYLHLLSDAVSSFGVILGGVLIYFFDIYWVDPLLTVLIGIYILKESYDIVIASIHILMEGVPDDIDLKDIQEEIERIEPVKNIHHLHVWKIGEHDIFLEAHIDLPDMKFSEATGLRMKINELLKHKFKITHSTLQFECNECKNIDLVKKG